MFTTLSTVRRFHVVSFVLTIVCFAALSCQTTAMGQNASGKKTVVAADAGRSSGDQKKETVTKAVADKNKPANSNSQNKTTKTTAKGTQNNSQKANSVKSSQEVRPFWENAWDDFKSFFSDQKETPVTTNVENSKETQNNTQENNSVKSSQEVRPFWENAWDDFKSFFSDQKETPVTSEVGNRAGDKKKTTTIKTVEKKTNPEKNKPAISNGQAKTTKTVVKGTQNNTQKTNSVKSSPQKSAPLSGKTQENVKPTVITPKKTPVTTNVGNRADVQKKTTVKTVEKKTNPEKKKPAVSSSQANTTKENANEQTINKTSVIYIFVLLSVIVLSILGKIIYKFWLEPYCKENWFRTQNKKPEALRGLALECIILGSKQTATDSENTKFPKDFIESILKDVENSDTPVDKRKWHEKLRDRFLSFFSSQYKKKYSITKDDIYLMVVVGRGYEDIKSHFENFFNNHTQKICDIYNKRFDNYRTDKIQLGFWATFIELGVSLILTKYVIVIHQTDTVFSFICSFLGK